MCTLSIDICGFLDVTYVCLMEKKKSDFKFFCFYLLIFLKLDIERLFPLEETFKD